MTEKNLKWTKCFVCCRNFPVWDGNDPKKWVYKNEWKNQNLCEKKSCRWLWDLLCEENEKIRWFPLFWVVWVEKVALPPPKILAVGCWAGVLGCALFGAWKGGTRSRERGSEGVCGKTRERRFYSVKMVVGCWVCALLCLPPTLQQPLTTRLALCCVVLLGVEQNTLMMRLTGNWMWCWGGMWEGNAVQMGVVG